MKKTFIATFVLQLLQIFVYFFVLLPQKGKKYWIKSQKYCSKLDTFRRFKNIQKPV